MAIKIRYFLWHIRIVLLLSVFSGMRKNSLASPFVGTVGNSPSPQFWGCPPTVPSPRVLSTATTILPDLVIHATCISGLRKAEHFPLWLLGSFAPVHLPGTETPLAQAQGVPGSLQRFQSSSSVDQLLSRLSRTLRQTRSGAGDAHASGQPLPLFRTLSESLHRCPQARLRTFPLVVGAGGDAVWRVEKGCPPR